MNEHAATQEQVQRFYDCEADAYDARRYESLRGSRRDRFHKDLLWKLLQEMPGGLPGSATAGQVLEVGCGTGRFLAALSEKGLRVTGTDLSAQMLSRARKRLDQQRSSDISLVQTSGLPFPAESFAAAYSIFVINLVPDYKRLFAQVARVLAKRGLFVFNVPNLTSVYWPFGATINRRRRTSSSNAAGARYSHWFSRREWQQSLAAAGFAVERVAGEPPWCGWRDCCHPVDGNRLAAVLCKSLFIQARLR